MKLKLYFLGKDKEVTVPEQELLRRIGFRASIESVALPQAGVKDAGVAKRQEAELFLNKISDQDFVVAFCEKGKQMSSVMFSKWLKQQFIAHREVVFVIGGAHGLDASVLQRANATLSFGDMVWTRNLFRYMALEQLYRALEIDGGSNFHKA